MTHFNFSTKNTVLSVFTAMLVLPANAYAKEVTCGPFKGQMRGGQTFYVADPCKKRDEIKEQYAEKWAEALRVLSEDVLDACQRENKTTDCEVVKAEYVDQERGIIDKIQSTCISIPQVTVKCNVDD